MNQNTPAPLEYPPASAHHPRGRLASTGLLAVELSLYCGLVWTAFSGVFALIATGADTAAISAGPIGTR